MREIRFRAWDNQAKVMLPVVDIEYLLTKGALITDYKYFVENIYPNIMQYTGLKDKNGVEIYEGDILSRSFMDDYPNQKSYVCFEDCGYKLKVKNGGNRPMSDRAGWCKLRRYGEIEVIGNIYEHPHLLGGE